MITIIDVSPNVLGYAINGRIEQADIERVFADMDAKVPAADKVRIYLEVTDPDGISLQALMRDVQLGVPRMNYLTRIECLVVVTDNDTVRSMVNVQGQIARWMEMRVFPMTEKHKAVTWVAGP